MNLNDMDNTAIRRCQLCGEICSVFWPDGQRLPAGLGGSPRTSNWHAHIARKYCPECAEKQRREDNRYWQRRHRQTRKQERRSYNQVIKMNRERALEAEKVVEAQRRYIRELEARCSMAELTRQNAYRDGRMDERDQNSRTFWERLTGR